MTIDWQDLVVGMNRTGTNYTDPHHMLYDLYQKYGNIQKISDLLGVSPVATKSALLREHIHIGHLDLIGSKTRRMAALPNAQTKTMTAMEIAKLIDCQVSYVRLKFKEWNKPFISIYNKDQKND